MNTIRKLTAPASLATFAGLSLITLLVSCHHLSQDDPKGYEIGAAKRGISIIPYFIPEGKYGRTNARKLSPKYITVHSTQNYDAGAKSHAKALSNGNLTSKYNRIGYLSWHFTVDDHSIYQSIPTNEQGQHADYEGPGNRLSIGIEMCENSGNSRLKTLENTAKLISLLMERHHIPISNVVPHQHWERIRYKDGLNVGHKNCPHFLMDNGKPGQKWREFVSLIRKS